MILDTICFEHIRVQKKSVFFMGKLKLACTSPKRISTSPNKFLMNRIHYWQFFMTEAWFKRRISHVLNLTQELNACEVRRLNQLNSTV